MASIEIRNLTPHTLNIFDAAGEVELTQIAPTSGEIARVSVEYVRAGELSGLPAFRASYGDVTGLPEPADGVAYIVSGLVAAAPGVAGREDVFAPGELVRDAKGRPIGCKGLKRA